jgi:hypothetical protein
MRIHHLMLVTLLGACHSARAERSAGPGADAAHPWRQPGDKIDSILPMPVYLERFRDGLKQPTGLTGGPAGRRALATAFLAGVSSSDTASLRGLLLSRAEFAWRFFPEHRYSRPPYELDPEVFWLQLRNESVKGLGRVLQRYGGHPLVLKDLECVRDTVQLVEGTGALWSNCILRFADGGREEKRRLFGSIFEDDGRARLVSFANEF